MSNPIHAIRGMNDILPTDTAVWQLVENTIRDVLQSYGYHEIRPPPSLKKQNYSSVL